MEDEESTTRFAYDVSWVVARYLNALCPGFFGGGARVPRSTDAVFVPVHYQ